MQKQAKFNKPVEFSHWRGFRATYGKENICLGIITTLVTQGQKLASLGCMSGLTYAEVKLEKEHKGSTLQVLCIIQVL